jgi:hypothetical protein
MDLGDIGWEGVDWKHLALNRKQWRILVNSEYGNVHSGSKKGGEFRD